MEIRIREVEDGSLENLTTLITGELEAMKGARNVYVMATLRHIAAIGGYIQNARELLPADKEFGAWLKNNFNWSQSHSLHLRNAGKVAKAFLSSNPKRELVATVLPKNEKQLREIARVTTDPKEVIDLWKQIEPELPKDSEGNVKSAVSIRKAITGDTEPTPKPKPKRKPQAPDFKALARQNDKLAEMLLAGDLDADDLPQSLVNSVYRIESILNN